MQIRGTLDYPKSLLDATEPVELLYYNGSWDLIFSKSIAIVGTRKPTEAGIRRAKKIANALVEKGFTVISGLAEGIDTAAHEAAFEANGRTIAVIGTPLDHVYPRSNAALMEKLQMNILSLAKSHSCATTTNPLERTGTLVQAKAALQQGRKLFILQSCFENKNISWPEKFEKLGAIRVKEFDDIWRNLEIDDESSEEN
ncbi:unnamed protein product [Diamesa hyperborea]